MMNVKSKRMVMERLKRIIKVQFVCRKHLSFLPMDEAMFWGLVKREGLEHKIEVNFTDT